MRSLSDQAQGTSISVSPELARLQAQQVDLSMRLATAKEELIQTVTTVSRGGVERATAERLVRRKESAVDDLQARLNATEEALTNARGELAPAVARAGGTPVGITVVPPQATMLGMLPSEFYGGVAGFLLLLPITIAVARRILRGGKRGDVNLEGNPQMSRLELAVEAIALEVERIGEAQRFTAKLAAERPREPAIERLKDAPKSMRRVITPLP